MKKSLIDKKKNKTFSEPTLQLWDTRSSVRKKYQEIQSLREKLNLLQQEPGVVPEADGSTEYEILGMPPTEIE